MLNEAALAAAKASCAPPRDGDIGAIFGIGFPPFRGGPLRMIDELGAAASSRCCASSPASTGTCFYRAGARLVTMAERGERFYPERSPPD